VFLSFILALTPIAKFIIVRVIARSRLLEMAAPWPDARKAVEDWYAMADVATWDNPQALRSTDPTASILANRRVVFNILGNRFRLVVKVDYREHKLFIRFFGTHQQYDAINASEI
jgi:mRNA interferase HigB